MRCAIGVDIGGTGIRAARVSVAGRILAHVVQPTAKSADAVVAQIDALIAEVDSVDVAAIGIGVPGRVDSARGLVFSGGFVDLSGPPLARRLRNCGTRVPFLDNDANMALVGESHLGAGSELAHVVLLTIGTGIGGALMQDGKLVRGRGTAGELGHVTVDMHGAACVCGRIGCLETASSGTALGRLIAAAGMPASTTAEELLARGDAAARAVLDAWARPLRAGMDSIAASFDPQCVILGGGLGAAACKALAAFPAVSPWYQYEVRPAELGARAGVIGAALAALGRAP